MDKNVMGHNFVLLKSGVDIIVFGGKAATAKDTEYIPDSGVDVIAHTKLIGGGETAVVEFDAPEAGTYDFLCSFPGHYAIMKGKFIVE
jgi:azurin